MQGLTKDPKGRYVFRCHVGGTKAGQRIKRILGKISFEEAKERAYILLQRYGPRRSHDHEIPPELTVKELAVEVLKLRKPEFAPSWADRLEGIFEIHLLPVLGARQVESLRPADVKSYRNARLRQGAKNATVNREISALYMVLNQGTILGLIARSPIHRGAVKHLEETPKTIWFTDEEWTLFLSAFDQRDSFRTHWRRTPVRLEVALRNRLGGLHGGPRPRTDLDPIETSDAAYERFRSLRPYFRALLQVAGRLSELRNLSWKDVDLKRGTLKLYQEKTRRPKLVHITDELREILRTLPPGVGDAPVFSWIDGRRLSREAVQKAFAMARRIAGLRPELTVHSIRHTAGARLAMQGYPARVIQEVLGHASPRQTERYMHLAPAHVRTAFAAISAPVSSTGDPRVTFETASGGPLKPPDHT